MSVDGFMMGMEASSQVDQLMTPRHLADPKPRHRILKGDGHGASATSKGAVLAAPYGIPTELSVCSGVSTN